MEVPIRVYIGPGFDQVDIPGPLYAFTFRTDNSIPPFFLTTLCMLVGSNTCLGRAEHTTHDRLAWDELLSMSGSRGSGLFFHRKTGRFMDIARFRSVACRTASCMRASFVLRLLINALLGPKSGV